MKKIPVLKSKDALKQMKHVDSIIDLFNWCDELGVCMTLGFSVPYGEYFINLNKGDMYTSVFISPEVMTQRPSHIYDLVLNAVKSLDISIAGKKDSSKHLIVVCNDCGKNRANHPDLKFYVTTEGYLCDDCHKKSDLCVAPLEDE